MFKNLFRPFKYSWCCWCAVPQASADHPIPIIHHLDNIPAQSNRVSAASASNQSINTELQSQYGIGTESNPFKIYRNQSNNSDDNKQSSIDNNNTTPSSSMRRLRFIIVSDTHCKFNQLNFPAGDVLIHCGDAVWYKNSAADLIEFNKQMGELKQYRYKLFVSGNHESSINPNQLEQTKSILSSMNYLQDELIDIDGVRIWGSPYRPARGCAYRAEAFGYNSNRIQADKWSLIPSNIDLLITHSPPYGCRDYEPYSKVNLGCPGLLDELVNRVKPAIHCFGHTHDCYGASIYNYSENQSLLDYYSNKYPSSSSLQQQPQSNQSNNNRNNILLINAASLNSWEELSDGNNGLNPSIVLDYYY